MIYDAIPGDCSQSVVAWLTLASLLVTFRTFLSLWHFQVWFARERKRLQGTAPNSPKTNPSAKRLEYDRCLTNKRLPIVPVVSLLETIFEILFVILTSCNVTSTRDGSSGFILALVTLANHLIALMFVHRMVKLGRKLVPISRGALVMSESLTKDLGTFNMLLTFLFYAAILACLSTFLCFTLGFLAYPGNVLLFRAMGEFVLNVLETSTTTNNSVIQFIYIYIYINRLVYFHISMFNVCMCCISGKFTKTLKSIEELSR